MEGTKIKNIIIIILLLLNGFLLFLVGSRQRTDTNSQDAARLGAIQVIQSGGIQLDENCVPKEMNRNSLRARRDLDRERALAADLLGAEVTEEARGGEVYRYSSPSGWVQFHSTGEFLAEFASGRFPTEGKSVREHGQQVLSRLDFESALIEDATTDGEGSITFRQTVDGVPVLGCQATLHYEAGVLVRITDGRRLPGQPYVEGEESSLTVATALMRLYNGLKGLGDVYNRMDSITPSYTLTVSLDGPARLDPVWHVKTDTGAYQLDTRSGQVSRMGGYSAPAAQAEQPMPTADEVQPEETVDPKIEP